MDSWRFIFSAFDLWGLRQRDIPLCSDTELASDISELNNFERTRNSWKRRRTTLEGRAGFRLFPISGEQNTVITLVLSDNAATSHAMLDRSTERSYKYYLLIELLYSNMITGLNRLEESTACISNNRIFAQKIEVSIWLDTISKDLIKKVHASAPMSLLAFSTTPRSPRMSPLDAPPRNDPYISTWDSSLTVSRAVLKDFHHITESKGQIILTGSITTP